MKLLISLIILLASINLYAQIDTLKSPMMKLTLKDSSVYYGRIISSDDSKLTLLKNNNVEIVIPKNEILEIYRVQDLPKEIKKTDTKKDSLEVEEKKYVDKGLHRMFFFPTANPVPNSEGYLSSNMIFFPFAAFGIANIFTIGGGVSLIPGATNQIYYFAPKITFLTLNNFSFATGGFIANSLNFSNSDGHSGMVYLIGTYNQNNNNFTAGIAYGYENTNMDDSPMIFIGYQGQIKNGSKFIAEAWLPSSKTSFPEITIIFAGFRFYNETFSGDVGLIRPANFNNNGFPFIPWINLTYNFTLYKKN